MNSENGIFFADMKPETEAQKFSEAQTAEIRSELIFDFVRSSGPGGQNVNKVSSKARLRWNIGRSAAFTDEEKNRIRNFLGRRVSGHDDLILTCDESRDQPKNKALVTERFFGILKEALAVEKERVPTRPTASARNKRLEAKKQTSIKKQQRSKKWEY